MKPRGIISFHQSIFISLLQGKCKNKKKISLSFHCYYWNKVYREPIVYGYNVAILVRLGLGDFK